MLLATDNYHGLSQGMLSKKSRRPYYSNFLKSLAQWLDRPLFPWKKLVMTFSLGHFVLENYIDWRQYRVLCQTKVPKALEAEIDQKTYDKSQVRRVSWPVSSLPY